jgi:glycosyltransferase involved in cell wall biosynthesis
MIVLLVPDFEPSVGGTTTQVALVGRELARRGRRVAVVTRRRDRSRPRRETLDGLAVVRLGLPGRGRFAERAAALGLAPWLAARRRRIAAVETVMWTDAAVAAAAAGLRGRTVVFWGALGDATAEVGAGRRSLRRAVRRRLLDGAPHVALTEPMAEELRSLGLRPAVVPIAVAPRFRPPSAEERTTARARLRLAGEELAVLYVGHLRRLKRVDRLLEAIARLRAEGVAARLVLAGGSRGADDDVEQKLRAQVQRLGVSEDVVFLGVVEDPLPVYHAGDVLVLPSEREGMPNVLVEAMACGLACVAPESAGGGELLADGAGIVPRSGDADALLEALRELAARPELRRELGAAAAARAAAHGVGSVTDAHERLLLGGRA